MKTELATLQRLGVICDELKANILSETLQKWLHEQNPSYTLLRADLKPDGAPRNDRWKVVMNDKIEIDE